MKIFQFALAVAFASTHGSWHVRGELWQRREGSYLTPGVFRSCNSEQVESVGRVPVLPKEVFFSENLSLQQIMFTKKVSEKELGKIGILFTMW